MLEERTIYWVECDECSDCTPDFDAENNAPSMGGRKRLGGGGAYPLPRMPPRFSHMLPVRAQSERSASPPHRICPPSR